MSGAIIGYMGVLVSVLCFGSNFVPLKRIKIGDGVFFQFCMCNAIFMTSIPVLIIQNFPKMHGLALLGGFLWCTGNMLCPISIRCIGMGMGLLVWGCVSMVMGWASGTFGLFGLKKQEVRDPVMNYIGIALAIVGLLIYLNIQTTDTSVDAAGSEDNKQHLNPLLDNDDEEERRVSEGVRIVTRKTNSVDQHTNQDNEEWTPNTKRVVGVVLAVIAGLFFGCSFDPSQYVIDNDYDGEDNPLNYVFAHFTGILITSWFYTMCYCLYKHFKGQEPFINSACILPATISGIMWGIAQISWFIANGHLGFTVTFPMISCGPGFVGALWGVFLFKEITGWRNFAILGTAVAVTLPALILVGVSH